MATFSQNNIQFTADNTTLKTDGKRRVKFGNSLNEDFSPEVIEDNGGIQPFINAVEIDWNSATLGDVTINTTGELLSYISNHSGGGISDETVETSKTAKIQVGNSYISLEIGEDGKLKLKEESAPKSAPEYITKPAANKTSGEDSLIYSGEELQLITPGSTNHGVILYSTDNKNFSMNIPTTANFAAENIIGTHTIYYYIWPDVYHENPEGFSPESLDVIITRAKSYKYSFDEVDIPDGVDTFVLNKDLSSIPYSVVSKEELSNKTHVMTTSKALAITLPKKWVNSDYLKENKEFDGNIFSSGYGEITSYEYYIETGIYDDEDYISIRTSSECNINSTIKLNL